MNNIQKRPLFYVLQHSISAPYKRGNLSFFDQRRRSQNANEIKKKNTRREIRKLLAISLWFCQLIERLQIYSLFNLATGGINHSVCLHFFLVFLACLSVEFNLLVVSLSSLALFGIFGQMRAGLDYQVLILLLGREVLPSCNPNSSQRRSFWPAMASGSQIKCLVTFWTFPVSLFAQVGFSVSLPV